MKTKSVSSLFRVFPFRSWRGATLACALAAAVAQAAPTITSQPMSHTVVSGQSVVLSVNASGSIVGYQWRKNNIALLGATSATYTIDPVASGDAGVYSVVVIGTDGSTTSADATLTLSSTSNVGRLINLGIRANSGLGEDALIVGFANGGAGTSGTEPVVVRTMGPSLAPYGVTAFMADPALNLKLGSSDVANNDNWGGDPALSDASARVGAFAFASATSKDAAVFLPSAARGTYSVVTSGPSNSTGIALAEIYDATPSASFTATSPRLINVSARSFVGTGDDVMIAGFYIGGSTSKTLLIRAAGPSLAAYGVSRPLRDPQLQLYSGSTLIRENDNWSGSVSLKAAFGQVAAFSFESDVSTDAAMIVTLPPGAYAALVRGAGNTTGVAVVEVYELK